MKLSEFIGLKITNFSPYHVGHTFGMEFGNGLSLHFGNVDTRAVWDYNFLNGFTLKNVVIGEDRIVIDLQNPVVGQTRRIAMPKKDHDKPFVIVGERVTIESIPIDASEFLL